jgi:hypothetical protein
MSNVSRSVYQKVKEENKKLLNDIKLLVHETPSAEKIICITKWRDFFRKEKEFNDLIYLALHSHEDNDNKL